MTYPSMRAPTSLTLVTVLALVLVVRCAPAAAQQTSMSSGEPDLASRVDLSGFPVYKDPAQRFSLQYPATWTEPGPDACFFAGALHEPESGPLEAALLTVVCSQTPGPAGDVVDVAATLGVDTPDAFDAFVARTEDETGSEIEPLSYGPARLAGRSAFRWTYRETIPADAGGIVLHVVQYVVVTGSTQYGVGCSVSESLGADMVTLCEALVRSFTLGTGSAPGARP
ncbi:MAG TPA: hypothetical protein VGB53_12765 [Rubricoccaceae bacterium]|jgi:hypothetical protein